MNFEDDENVKKVVKIGSTVIIIIIVLVLINLAIGITGSVYGLNKSPKGKRLVAGILSVVGIFIPPIGIIGGGMAIAWRNET
jgi:flagellar basal body-associated protein FliL